MTKIGLLSDTHGYIDPLIFEHFAACDELWHVGDFGSLELVKALQDFKPLKGVYGNIDDASIQHQFPEENFFNCENVAVYMRHIGGYPGRYATGVKDKIIANGSRLFLSGHSHILKVMFDEKLNCLHINPGAAGKHGWHKMKTMIRFEIDDAEIRNLEIIELGERGSLR